MNFDDSAEITNKRAHQVAFPACLLPTRIGAVVLALMATVILSGWDILEESSDTWAPIITFLGVAYVTVRVLAGVLL